MADLQFISRDTDRVPAATLTASSTQAGSAPANAATDDPTLAWTANSGTATLTVTLNGSQSVGAVGLVATNADDGKVITIAGGITGTPTLTADRTPSGGAVDLVYLVDPPQTLSAVTFAITGNSTNWSVGRVLVGGVGSIPNYLDGFTPTPRRPQYSDENDFGHDIRYDLGVELWTLEGDVILTRAQQATLDAWWRSTKAGFYPTTVIPDATLYPPFLVRMAMSLPRKHDNKYLRTSLKFTQVCNGLEVV